VAELRQRLGECGETEAVAAVQGRIGIEGEFRAGSIIRPHMPRDGRFSSISSPRYEQQQHLHLPFRHASFGTWRG